MKKTIVLIFLIIYSLSIFAFNEIKVNDYIKTKNIRMILKEIRISSIKDQKKIIDLLLKNKEEFAVGQFNLIMDYIRDNYTLMEYVDKLMKKYTMDERVYPYLLEYYEINNNKKLIDFILMYQNDKIDYWKYAKIFYIKGILEKIAKKSNKKYLLHLYANGIMYSRTNNNKYLKNILKHNKEQIIELLKKEVFNDNQQIEIIEKTVKKYSIEGFEDFIIKLAIYFPQNNYDLLFKNSIYEEHYKILRSIFNGNNEKIPEPKDINDSLLIMTMYLYNNKYDDFQNMSKQFKARRSEILYLNTLYYLFKSDFKNFNKSVSIFLINEKNTSIRMNIIKYYLFTQYIEDGTVYKYYSLGNYDKIKPIIVLIGKNSPMYYEYLLINKQYEQADSILNNMYSDANKYALILIIDYQLKRINKKHIEEFMKLYPDYPFNIYFEEFIK